MRWSGRSTPALRRTGRVRLASSAVMVTLLAVPTITKLRGLKVRLRLVPRSRAVKLSSAVSSSASMALAMTPERLSRSTTPLAARQVAATRFSNSSISPFAVGDPLGLLAGGQYGHQVGQQSGAGAGLGLVEQTHRRDVVGPAADPRYDRGVEVGPVGRGRKGKVAEQVVHLLNRLTDGHWLERDPVLQVEPLLGMIALLGHQPVALTVQERVGDHRIKRGQVVGQVDQERAGHGPLGMMALGGMEHVSDQVGRVSPLPDLPGQPAVLRSRNVIKRRGRGLPLLQVGAGLRLRHQNGMLIAQKPEHRRCCQDGDAVAGVLGDFEATSSRWRDIPACRP